MSLAELYPRFMIKVRAKGEVKRSIGVGRP
jgi:hypothetical protein